MTLKEIAKDYEAAAVPLRNRLRELRRALKATEDPEEIFRLKRRIAELTPMLTQCNALAELCEHYYEPGYWRDDTFCFPGGRLKKKRCTRGSEDDARDMNLKRGENYQKENPGTQQQ